jgi:hypothetical protein
MMWLLYILGVSIYFIGTNDLPPLKWWLTLVGAVTMAVALSQLEIL